MQRNEKCNVHSVRKLQHASWNNDAHAGVNKSLTFIERDTYFRSGIIPSVHLPDNCYEAVPFAETRLPERKFGDQCRVYWQYSTVYVEPARFERALSQAASIWRVHELASCEVLRSPRVMLEENNVFQMSGPLNLCEQWYLPCEPPDS